MKRGTTADGAVPRRVQGRTAPRSSGDCCKSAVSEGSRSFPTIGLFGSMPRMAAGQVAKYITGCSAPLNRNVAASDRWSVIGDLKLFAPITMCALVTLCPRWERWPNLLWSTWISRSGRRESAKVSPSQSLWPERKTAGPHRTGVHHVIIRHCPVVPPRPLAWPGSVGHDPARRSGHSQAAGPLRAPCRHRDRRGPGGLRSAGTGRGGVVRARRNPPAPGSPRRTGVNSAPYGERRQDAPGRESDSSPGRDGWEALYVGYYNRGRRRAGRLHDAADTVAGS